ncbi:MAG: ATP-binding protein [Cellvibrionaceae bacterium]
MKGYLKRIKLASLITISISIWLSISFIAVQFLNHNLQREFAAQIQKALSDGILNSLQFAIISNDIVLITQQVDKLIKNEEIYALEVSDSDGKVLYRKDKENNRNITINTKKYEVFLPFDGIKIDEFSEENSHSQELVGFIKIYFSTEHIDKKIKSHFLYTALILGVAALFVILGFLYFKNHNEKELKKIIENTVSLKNKAEEAEKFKDDFIKAISHDIRRPVGIIVKLLESIYDEIKSNKVKYHSIEKIEACYYSSKTLHSVTEELFNFNQFQQQKLENNREVTNISVLFDSFYNMFKEPFDNKGISFKLVNINNYQKDEFAYFDYKKLSRIVENILDNSLKFTEEGSVTLSWEIENSNLKISIKDTGIGISDNKTEKIFNKHIQLKEQKVDLHEGRGLGLYYAKKLLDAINANVSVDSKIGLGSEFSLSIPIELVTSFSDTSAFSMVGYTAIIIDSEKGTCLALESILSNYGIKCEVYSIPENGLSKIIESAPDLVFIDFNILKLKNNPLLAKIKKSTALANTIFISMIGGSEEEPMIKMDDHFKTTLRKNPFSSIHLHSMLDDIKKSREETKKIIGSLSQKKDKD